MCVEVDREIEMIAGCTGVEIAVNMVENMTPDKTGLTGTKKIVQKSLLNLLHMPYKFLVLMKISAIIS